MTILQAENLSFAFGHVALLDKASFQLAAGDKVGLIGRNGAGKSSLLKILAGVQKPDDGQLILQNGLKTVYVPQESFFDGAATVFDIVSEGLGSLRDVLRRYHEIGRELAHGQNDSLIKELNELQNQIEAQNGWQFDALVSQTIGELGLPENEKIANLSGGQKKRVALAQAWVQKPDILLLDEPTNHLDIDAILWLENLLKNFAGSLIVITHDRRFLDNVANRIVELDRGSLRSYPGSFAKYSEKKAEELAVEAEHNRLFDKFHAQEEAWIRKGIEARRTRNEGRVKRLEELRKQRAARRERQGQVSFKLDSGEKSGKIVAELEHASFAYGNKLVLDEPTNDLDIDTQELLEELLRDYAGTVFLVSHDRMFLDNVITQSIVFEGEGRLKEYIGGYQDYADAKAREEKVQAASAPAAKPERPSEKDKPKPNRTAKLSYKEQRELDALPDEIAALEAEQADLNAQLSDPEIFKDYEKAGSLQTRAEEIETLLLEKLERWEMLEGKQNGG